MKGMDKQWKKVLKSARKTWEDLKIFSLSLKL